MADTYVSISVRSATLRRRSAGALAASGLTVTPLDDLSAEGLHVVHEKVSPRGGPQVVLVSRASRRQTAQLLDAGALGIVCSDDLETALGPTVLAALAGQVAVPLSVRSAVRRPMLSPREKQILGMVVIGLTNQEIGARLHLAPSTIKSHLGTMFAELGVRSRKEAADLVLDPTAGLGTGILRITTEEDDAPGARG